MRFYVKMLIALLLCVLLPCITVALITNYAFTELYRENISNSQLNRLRAVSNTNGIVVDMIEESAMRFTFNPNVQALGNNKSLDALLTDDEYPGNIIRVNTLLQEIVRSSDLYESVYLHVADTDYIVSSRNGALRLDSFPDLGWMEKYAELRSDRGGVRLIPAHAVYASYGVDYGRFDSYGRRCVTYVYPITQFTTVFDGALVFNLYEDRLTELYTLDSENGNITVLERDGSFLIGTEPEDYIAFLDSYGEGEMFAPGDPDSGYFITTISGERRLCNWYAPNDGKLVFLSMESMDKLMEKQLAFQFSLFVFLLLLIPVASLLVLLVSRRLYSPIGKLVKELKSNGRFYESGEKDELSVISYSINELLREDYRLFADNSREKLREAAFLRVLAGGGDDGEDAGAIIPYPRNICILAAPSLNGYDKKGHNDIYDTRMRLLVRVIQGELSGEGISAAALRYEDDIVVAILSVRDETDELRQMIENRLCRVRETDVMGCPVTFAVGSVTDDLAGVRQSFGEAKAALSYRFIRGLDNILFYDEVFKAVEYFDATERIQNICRLLDGGKKDEVLADINGLIRDIELHSHISFTNVTQILNQLLSGLMQYVTENEVPLEELINENTVIYRALWRNSSLKEAGEWLCGVFSSVFDYQNAADNMSSVYIKKTIDYVKENYAKDITIDSIASHIGISYSYLRKIFKYATNKNLADYIVELRIQKAKQLLVSTSYTIKEISAMCGYNHERSFSRSFAQTIGMSPGKYKAQHKACQSNPDKVEELV